MKSQNRKTKNLVNTNKHFLNQQLKGWKEGRQSRRKEGRNDSK